jgi:hypothetical protein
MPGADYEHGIEQWGGEGPISALYPWMEEEDILDLESLYCELQELLPCNVAATTVGSSGGSTIRVRGMGRLLLRVLGRVFRRGQLMSLIVQLTMRTRLFRYM